MDWISFATLVIEWLESQGCFEARTPDQLLRLAERRPVFFAWAAKQAAAAKADEMRMALGKEGLREVFLETGQSLGIVKPEG